MVKFKKWAVMLTFFIIFASPAQIFASSLSSEALFSMVNEHRVKIGKAVVAQDERICTIAQNRAPSVRSEIYGGYMHAGFHRLNLSYWATEIIIDMRTDSEAMRWWLNSPVHRSVIQGDYQYACIGCSGNSCAGIFTNFSPK